MEQLKSHSLGISKNVTFQKIQMFRLQSVTLSSHSLRQHTLDQDLQQIAISEVCTPSPQHTHSHQESVHLLQTRNQYITKFINPQWVAELGRGKFCREGGGSHDGRGGTQRLEALPVDDGGTVLIVLLLGDPHLRGGRVGLGLAFRE